MKPLSSPPKRTGVFLDITCMVDIDWGWETNAEGLRSSFHVAMRKFGLSFWYVWSEESLLARWMPTLFKALNSVLSLSLMCSCFLNKVMRNWHEARRFWNASRRSCFSWFYRPEILFFANKKCFLCEESDLEWLRWDLHAFILRRSTYWMFWKSISSDRRVMQETIFSIDASDE